ncbi:MAG: hypothetical protein JW800_08335 [Candidatus Omnitrophica bacterium]|nr:hypothetical protein [Candidatus Omnitrophota bacterium]
MGRCNLMVIITSSSISSGAYESHVISLAEALKGRLSDIALFSFSDKKMDMTKKGVIDKRLARLKTILGEENVTLFKNKGPLAARFQIEKIKNIINIEKRTFLLCQNYYAGLLGAAVKTELPNVHLHVDFKGVVPQENLLYSGVPFIVRLALFLCAKVFEKRIFEHADSFSAVSERFRGYLSRIYHVGRRPFLVLPSAVDESRFFYKDDLRREYKKRLPYGDSDTIVTFCGSMKRWQEADSIFRLMKGMSGLSGYRFLILTLDRKLAERYRQRYAIPADRTRIISAPTDEINGYLNASDICLLLRNDDIVNNVASPTKFGEYLVTKNKIVISDNVGDFSDIVKQSEYGVCLKTLDIDAEKLARELDRKRKPSDDEIDKFKEEYSLKKNIEKIVRLL